AGIFFSSHILPDPGAKTAGSPVLRIPLLGPDEVKARDRDKARMAELDKEIEGLLAEHYAAASKEMLPQIDKYLLAAYEYAPLPPKSLAIHPSPTGGVAVGWKSPISGTVRITGRVMDADNVCGNGVAWGLGLRLPSGGTLELLSGAIENGGTNDFAMGRAGDR